MGLAASCGSAQKKKRRTKEMMVLYLFSTEKQLPAGEDTINLLSLQQDGKLLMVHLHCIGSGTGEAGSGGDIIYDKKLSNFELDLEWKISEGGNSGIFILAQELPNEPIYKSSPEMQILDNERHPDAKLGVDGNRMAGSLYDLIPAKPQNTKPAGEWNHVHILVYQGTVVFSSERCKCC